MTFHKVLIVFSVLMGGLKKIDRFKRIFMKTYIEGKLVLQKYEAFEL